MGALLARARPLGGASDRALRLLVALGFSREEREEALAALGGREAASDWRDGELIRAILEAAAWSRSGAARLEQLLAQRLGGAAARYRGRAPFELAQLWARDRPRLRGKALAALLFTAATAEGVPMRKLEARLIEEIEALALDALTAPAEREDPGNRDDRQRETLGDRPRRAAFCAGGLS